VDSFLWGFIIAAFNMAYIGKWIRRSGVITGAEWMVKRFGAGRQGDLARLAYTVYAVVTISAFLGTPRWAWASSARSLFPRARCWRRSSGGARRDVVHRRDRAPVCDAHHRRHGRICDLRGLRALTLVEFFQTIILSLGAIIVAWLGSPRSAR